MPYPSGSATNNLDESFPTPGRDSITRVYVTLILTRAVVILEPRKKLIVHPSLSLLDALKGFTVDFRRLKECELYCSAFITCSMKYIIHTCLF